MNNTDTKKRKSRLQMVNEALAVEMMAYNDAVTRGAEVFLSTSTGQKVAGRARDTVAGLTVDLPRDNGGFGMSAVIGNDARWADLLRQAGVSRHPLFADS